jgi:hypothetical protein
MDGTEPAEPGPSRGHWLVQTAPALRRLGDETQARTRLEEAAVIGESLKGRWAVRGSLIRGLALAPLGRCTEALALAATFPETERDAFFGVFVRDVRAEIATVCGDHKLALDELEELLATPYLEAITVWDLRLDPRWEPLRDDPRFQALVARDGNEISAVVPAASSAARSASATPRRRSASSAAWGVPGGGRRGRSRAFGAPRRRRSRRG